MKPYYAAQVFYFPLQYAISLYNLGYSEEDAAKKAIDRFAFYGKNNTKRLKDFDRDQFRKHLHRFIHTKNAVLMRKTPKRRTHR